MKYLIERQDGGCSLMHLIGNADLAECVAKWAALNGGAPISVQPVVDEPDHEFFDGWKHIGGGRVGFDMDKCRNIHRQKIREARKSRLADLDIEYQRADEAGDSDKKKAIAAEKQRLRDATSDPAIEAAKTPDDLKGLWPFK